MTAEAMPFEVSTSPWINQSSINNSSPCLAMTFHRNNNNSSSSSSSKPKIPTATRVSSYHYYLSMLVIVLLSLMSLVGDYRHTSRFLSMTAATMISMMPMVEHNNSNNNVTTSTIDNEHRPPVTIPKEEEDSPTHVVHVVVWPDGDHVSEAIHIVKDGIAQSRFLQQRDFYYKNTLQQQQHMVPPSSVDPNNNNDDDTWVWVGQAFAVYKDADEWCHAFQLYIEETTVREEERRRQRQATDNNNTVHVPPPPTTTTTSRHVFIIDYSDNANEQVHCTGIERLVGGPEYVHYSKRSIVRERHWNDTTQWIDVGRRVDHAVESYRQGKTTNEKGRVENATTTTTTTVLHTSYPVRTDTLQTMEQVLRRNYFHGGHRVSLADPIETILDRPYQVTHFWPLDSNHTNKFGKGWYPKFRWRVSSILTEFVDRHNYTSYIGVAGKMDEKGRRGVHRQYVKTLLESKIVVLTQRDEWEDHYRLMEAMISGAMILTDRMLSLPEGYCDGVSIVEFSTPAELKEKITYYLEHPKEREAIAAAGRHLAMSRHRSWHIMERIIFGAPVTTCADTSSQSRCPYSVNAPNLARNR